MSESQVLFQYIIEGRIKDFEIFLKQNVRPLRNLKDPTGYSLIHFAVLNEKEEVINLIVHHVNYNQEKSLNSASQHEINE